MAGSSNFPNRKWTRALVLASASAIVFTGSVTADDKKPAARPSAPAAVHAPAAAPRATPSAGHATPSAPGGHATPSAAGHATPSSPGHATPSSQGHATPSSPGGHTGGMPNAGGSRPGGGTPATHNAGTSHSGAPGGMNRASQPRVGPTHGPASTAHNVRSTPSGHQVAMHGGRPSEIRSHDMMIRRGPSGMRRTVVERNGRVYSFNRAGYGHIRSGYAYGGHNYAVRRYYVGGAYYPRYYRSYGYRGVFFDAYAPGVYYSPYYYGWAYRPWAAPVAFSWGWGGSPWYGYYGGYFTPYPSYPSANLWLTDYIVAQTLEASYRERSESARASQQQFDNQPPAQQAALTPEIKQMIAEEVQRQLRYEAAEASARRPEPGAPPAPPQETDYTGVGRMIEDNNTHVLLSNANIDVTTLSGQECAISQGDALAVTPGQAGGQGETVQVKVLASAGNGCPSNSVVTVSLQDLQEMVNHVRATLDSGLAAMQKDPKLPKPPSTVPTTASASEFAAAAPPADPNEAAELARLNQEASTTEQTVFKETSYQETTPMAQTPPASTSASATLSTELQPGMTPEQAISIKGAPAGNTKFGAKQILTYPDVKLTFTNGKLTDIQ